MLGTSQVAADRLILKSGRVMTVDTWWVDGATLFYETDSGTIGIPRADVMRIEKTEEHAPSFKSAPPGDSNTASPGTTVQAPAQRLPSAAELDSAIDEIAASLRREGQASSRARLKQQLADIHTLRARLAREAGARDAALDHLNQALELIPDHRVARPDLGWLLLEMGRSDRAMSLTQSWLVATPNDSSLLTLRGELLYRDNRLGAALADFEAAAAARPNESVLQQRIDRIRRDLQVEASNTRKESQHFVLSFDGDRDETLGRAVTDELENAWRDLTREIDAWPGNPIPVVLSTRDEFASTTQSGPEVLGLFDGKIRLPLGGLTRVTPPVVKVLRHELTHALLHDKGRGRVPRWLHEGLAQLMEPRSPGAYEQALRPAAQEGSLDIEPFSYPTALSFVSFLDGQFSRARLLWFVDLLAEGRSETEAFEQAFGAPREDLQNAWRRSFQPLN